MYPLGRMVLLNITDKKVCRGHSFRYIRSWKDTQNYDQIV